MPSPRDNAVPSIGEMCSFDPAAGDASDCYSVMTVFAGSELEDTMSVLLDEDFWSANTGFDISD